MLRATRSCFSLTPRESRRVLLPVFTYVLWFSAAIAVLFSHVTLGANIALWPLDEGGGTTVVDVAGGHNGTLQGGGAWVAGQFGSALLLDGVDDTVIIPDHPDLDYSSYAGLTLAVWMRPDRVGHSSDQTVFGHWHENRESRSFRLTLRQDDRWQCNTNKKNGTAVSTSVANVGVWAHVACVWTPTGLEVYVDGVLEGSDLDVQGVLDGNSGTHVLGASDVGGVLDRFFQGALDEVSLFDQGLSVAEIQALMSGPGDPGPDPVDSYALDIIDLGDGNVRVTGTGGSVAPSLQVIIENTDTGEQLVVLPEPDGSFSVELSAQPGDLLTIVVTDDIGNSSAPTEVYAGAYTIKSPYTSDGHWYLGEGHLHTTNSRDARDTPEEMEAAYFDAGYDFIVSTDHRGEAPLHIEADDGLTPDPNNLSVKDLLWISGTELGYGEVHMGGWGHTVRVPFTELSVQELVDTVRSTGGIVAMNHPGNPDPPYAWNWHRETSQVRGFSVVEAYNGPPRAGEEGLVNKRHAVDLADAFRQVWWIGTDDVHDKDGLGFDQWALVVQTASPVISQRDILGSVDSGNMYIRQTSAGPEIDSVEVAGNTVTVTLADIGSTYDVVWKQRGDEIVKQDPGIDTVSSYVVQGNEGYVRAEIERTDDGLDTFTQPLFIGNAEDLSISASASSGTGDQYLVDNDGSTIWDAGTSSGSFVIDVGQVRQLNAIRIDWLDTDERRFNYRIESSVTGVFGGEEVEVVRETYDNRSADTLDFFDTYARYVRVMVTSQSAGSGDVIRIREVEVFDSSPGRTDHYVDNVNGDDINNNGLAGSPWRTFNYAREKTRPRDTLHLIDTGIPFIGGMELLPRHSGKHPGATTRYQGDVNSLTEIDATGYEYGLRFVSTGLVEWMYFDVHSASGGNVVVAGADKSTEISRSRLHHGLSRGIRADGSFTLSYSLIHDNAKEGVFVYRDGNDVGIFNNVIYGNSRGLYLKNYIIDAIVRNNILSGNSSVALYELSSGVIIDSHNCVDGGYIGDWQKLSNVEADPLFVDPVNGDFSLLGTSPCIDAGIDLDIMPDYSGNDAYDAPSVPNTGSPGAFSRDYIDIGAFELN